MRLLIDKLGMMTLAKGLRMAVVVFLLAGCAPRSKPLVDRETPRSETTSWTDLGTSSKPSPAHTASGTSSDSTQASGAGTAPTGSSAGATAGGASGGAASPGLETGNPAGGAAQSDAAALANGPAIKTAVTVAPQSQGKNPGVTPSSDSPVAVLAPGAAKVAAATAPAAPAATTGTTTAPAAAKPATCAFKNTFIFGASISADTMLKQKDVLAMLDLPFSQADFGLGPAELLTQAAGGTVAINDAAAFGVPTGAQEISTMLTSQKNLLMSSSAIVGVDAFYWDAQPDKCDAAIAAAGQLIQFSKAEQKVLILGNVPVEVPANVALAQLPEPLQSMIHWTPPQPECVMKINKFLAENCLKESRCFIVDTFGLAQKLNSDHKIQTANGRTLTLEQVRPDGVHLSTAGSNLLASQIVQQLKQLPDSFLCPKTGPATGSAH